MLEVVGSQEARTMLTTTPNPWGQRRQQRAFRCTPRRFTKILAVVLLYIHRLCITSLDHHAVVPSEYQRVITVLASFGGRRLYRSIVLAL